MTTVPAIDGDRVLADLRELHSLTGGPEGAQRLCWGEQWRTARSWLGELLRELGLEPERDEAGNLWAYLDGEAEPALAVGSHIDSVPDGGWLDGCLGVLAGLGVLRAWVESGRRPPRTLALLDLADEEGARFGRSLFGSSALSGSIQPAALRDLRDASGRPISEVLAENDVELEGILGCGFRLERVGAYLELHIEQGPVLEAEGLPCAAVAGCAGVERELLRFAGQASHAGTTPMDARRDAGLAAAQAALEIERIARAHGGVGTTGLLELEPGIVTAVAGGARLGVDLRHPERERLAAMHGEARTAAREAAELRGCSLDIDPVWSIEPTPFDSGLVQEAAAAARAAGGRERPLTSGALHDAAELARVVPAAMIFSSSTGGLSHTREENTPEAHLRAAIGAFGELCAAALGSLTDA